MHDEESYGWLWRWARRRASAEQAPEKQGSETGNAKPNDAAAISASPPPTEADLASLDAASDYARFLAGDVAPGLRVEALRRLWASDPGLAEPDGLIDYSGDYGMAGLAPGDVLTTAYRIGTGLLTDEEAAGWAALGCPEPAATDPAGS